MTDMLYASLGNPEGRKANICNYLNIILEIFSPRLFNGIHVKNRLCVVQLLSAFP